MTAPDDSQTTRPISVAELLAKNGTIGAPPVGGRRRRRRGNSDAVTVAELTGEIPIIRTGEIPVAREEAPAPVAPEEVAPEAVATEAVATEEVAPEPVAEETPKPASQVEEVAGSPDTNGSAAAAPVEAPVQVEPETEQPERPFDAPPERADAPLPRRETGPARSYDPRPRRRSVAPPAEVAASISETQADSESGAEQMTFDPLDDSATLLDLTDAQEADGAAELQSYLRSSGGTLFGGETVADDLARRGLGQDEPTAAVDTEPAPGKEKVRGGTLAALARGGLVALQSILAVAFGAGLFIAFDQLWRWNNIVALVLSVLVILGLVVAVRVVRKTEDIASTLIAVAVGALVTLGPLALLQST